MRRILAATLGRGWFPLKLSNDPNNQPVKTMGKS